MYDHFKIYDLNFNPVPLPVDEVGYGLRGLDLEVSSIGQEVTEHSMSGRPGNVTTGVRDTDRDMTLSARIKAMNATDYRLKRDRVYSFFRGLGAFYVTETLQGNKLMKVRVIEKYTPERPQNMQRYAFVDIPLQIDGQPYWISRYTTMDLHNNKGIPANGNWSFGMGIDVSPDNLVYQYENVSEFNIYNAGIPLKTIQEKDNCEIRIEINENITNFSLFDAAGGEWKYNPEGKTANIITFEGSLQDKSIDFRSGEVENYSGRVLTDYIKVEPDSGYTNSGVIASHYYDENKKHIAGRTGSTHVSPDQSYWARYVVDSSDVKNAIVNKGKQLTKDWSLKTGDIIIFKGHDVRLNKTTIMERTNRYYPIIKEGINKFKVDGLLYYKITFDFRFKYY